VRVSLTPRSRALAARMAPPIDAIYAAIEAELGAKAIQQLYAVLDTLIATLAAGDTPADGS
jgi:DNA-binding MarR family transcriptional regulator